MLRRFKCGIVVILLAILHTGQRHPGAPQMLYAQEFGVSTTRTTNPIRCDSARGIWSRAKARWHSFFSGGATPMTEQRATGGALLKSGSFQLGPGIAQDLLHSQGDGLWGFPIP